MVVFITHLPIQHRAVLASCICWVAHPASPICLLLRCRRPAVSAAELADKGPLLHLQYYGAQFLFISLYLNPKRRIGEHHLTPSVLLLLENGDVAGLDLTPEALHRGNSEHRAFCAVFASSRASDSPVAPLTAAIALPQWRSQWRRHLLTRPTAVETDLGNGAGTSAAFASAISDSQKRHRRRAGNWILPRYSTSIISSISASATTQSNWSSPRWGLMR